MSPPERQKQTSAPERIPSSAYFLFPRVSIACANAARWASIGSGANVYFLNEVLTSGGLGQSNGRDQNEGDQVPDVRQ